MLNNLKTSSFILIFGMALTTQLRAQIESQGWDWPSQSSYEHITDYKKANPGPGPEPKCVVNVKKTMNIKGTLDGKGCLYRWRGEGYPKKCHASKEISESEPRMFVMSPGSTIKNLQMECSLDGILMNDNTTIDNIVNRDCEEDCVTTNGKNNTIKNSKFFLCQDKCLQLNQASNVKILNNEFYHAQRPMSGSAGKRGGATNIQAVGNYCYNCEIMIRAQSNHDFHAKDNELKKGECLFETVDKSVIYDQGGNTVSDATIMCADGTKNVKPE
jgi:hypothetical protein